MNDVGPNNMDPAGAPNPFDKDTTTESAPCTISGNDRPEAVAAFHIRAPSR